jgi:hypothetical protein
MGDIVKSVIHGSTFNADHWNDLQDQTTLLKAATHEEGSLPTAFKGGTWLWGEYTINAVTAKIIDNSRDWRDCMALMYVFYVSAANELPSGAAHTPDDIPAANREDLFWNLKDGDDGAFGAGGHWWKPFGAIDLYLYADDTNGYLYAKNTNGVNPYYFYILYNLTGVIE